MQALPLRGVRVVDFTWLGAGPYTTRVLADHGAEVIRIESGKRLDRLRILPPFRDGKRNDSVNRSGYFADRNSNKLSVTVNLKHPDAAALILRLIAQADIVTSNFTPGTLDDLGLGYEQAGRSRPDIIFLEMGMQGSYGPDSKLVGYGQTVSALTGLYHLSGLPGRMPVGTGTNYPDHVAGAGPLGVRAAGRAAAPASYRSRAVHRPVAGRDDGVTARAGHPRLHRQRPRPDAAGQPVGVGRAPRRLPVPRRRPLDRGQRHLRRAVEGVAGRARGARARRRSAVRDGGRAPRAITTNSTRSLPRVRATGTRSS